MKKERREFVRLGKPADITYAPMAKMHPPFSSLSKDISGGGIRISLKGKTKKGEVLELEIDLPGKKPIFALGKIVWIKRKGQRQEAGIKFISIEPEDKKEIFSFAT